jgi:DNA-binding MarR family transcriptional regulator
MVIRPLPPLDPTPPPRNLYPNGKYVGREKQQKRLKESDKKRVAGERFRVLNDFVDCTMSKLSRSEIAVWLILYRDTRDDEARAAMTDLARRAGCTKRAAVNAVKRLEALGLLEVLHRGGWRRGMSIYRCISRTKP